MLPFAGILAYSFLNDSSEYGPAVVVFTGIEPINRHFYANQRTR